METRRRFHLGIDYGTSTSKVVVRDYGAPGGERASVLVATDGFRFSSSVLSVGDELFFGKNRGAAIPGRWYDSIKMRVAGEVKGDLARYCYPAMQPLPTGLTAGDLATLTIWWLIGLGRTAVESLAPRIAESGIALGMTVGVPMSFFRDPTINAAFLRIARTAWLLHRRIGNVVDGRIAVSDAKNALQSIRSATDVKPVPEDEVRDWIRAEAEAAMWWPFQSPAVPSGPYCKVDIGAGTTNASVFRLEGTPRERIAFFGADSQPFGMDAIDDALGRWKGSEGVALRASENAMFEEQGSVGVCRDVLDGITGALREAWREHRRKNGAWPAEMNAWRQARVFIIGGGSLVVPVRREVARYPMDPMRSLEIMDIECPVDLDLVGARPVPPSDLPFLLVAYGLSHVGLAIPMAETPDQVPALPPRDDRRARLDHDDIYAR
jgi:hypothetical protein